MFLVNSRYPLVCATHSGSGRRPFTLIGSSFFRSYGGNLPSSLTIVLPIALVFSTRPPVSVWGTGAVPARCWAFLGSVGLVTSPKRLGITSRTHGPTLIGPSYSLTRRQPSLRFTYPSASPFSYPPPTRWDRPEGQPPRRESWAGRVHGGTGISTSCASTTPCGLALAPDSPWED